MMRACGLWSLTVAVLLAGFCQASATVTPASAAGGDAVRQEFIAAMQRVRLRSAEPPDSPALEAYVIHDYLVAARLRRDLDMNPSDAVDGSIDAFLRAHPGQPAARALRHDWLASLADRKRWDWFLPRSADVTDAQLVCDRLTGRLATGATEGLALDALARWSTPQKQPAECNAVFDWLRAQGQLTPALADARTRAALAADNPRLARDFIADIPAASAGPVLQWLRLLEAPKAAVALLSLNPGMPVEADALVAGFNRLSSSDFAAASTLLPALLK